MAYSFRVDAGGWYQQPRFREFIVTEVRPRLSAGGGNFTITMRDDTTADTLAVTIRRTDLYITHLAGVAIPGHLLNYGDNPVLVNIHNIGTAFNDARGFNGGVGPQTHNTLRVLPFLFSEAARFPIVNFVVGRVFNSGGTVRWRDYRDIIRNWQVLSNWATERHLVPGDAVAGSNGKFAPIEPDVIRDYNANHVVKLQIPAGCGM